MYKEDLDRHAIEALFIGRPLLVRVKRELN
jgi:hypothetical protein